MTDPGWLEEIRATAVALGTRIVVLPPHGSNDEPVELDGRPGADNTWGALLGAGPSHGGPPYEHRHTLPGTEDEMAAAPAGPAWSFEGSAAQQHEGLQRRRGEGMHAPLTSWSAAAAMRPHGGVVFDGTTITATAPADAAIRIGFLDDRGRCFDAETVQPGETRIIGPRGTYWQIAFVPPSPDPGRAAILRAAGLTEEQIAKELGT